MFDRLVLRGATASIVWGYRTAAQLGAWTITRDKTNWILRATVQGVDRFMVKQTKPTRYFVAPRHYGHCAWPVAGDVRVETNTLVATLREPEQ